MNSFGKIKELFVTNFQLAYIKLTLFYVLIIMIISVSFSIAIFRISSNEIHRGLGRQNGYLHDIQIDGNMMNLFGSFEQLRQLQVDEATDNMRDNLIFFNILILMLSTIGSYFFARKTLEPIEESFAAQNRFTADASHELRTPLTAMKTEIEVALRDEKITLLEAKKLLESNLEEINKLETLSSSLLKLAHHRAGSQDGFSIVNLTEVIDKAIQNVSRPAAEKKIEFKPVFDKADKNPVPKTRVHGDQTSLVELFTILFDNAVKYCDQNAIINITAKQHGSKTIVTVADNGPGIKASDLPYIFNRFYRADSARSKDKALGYGLGLAIAKDIVDFHNATINATSKIGEGTTFVIAFPRQISALS